MIAPKLIPYLGNFAALALRNRGALGALLVRSLGVAAGFALTFLIARWYGPEANGIYALVTQSAMLLSVVAVGGLDLAVIREFSRAVAENKPIARRSLSGVLVQTIALATLIGGAVLAFSDLTVPWLLGEAATVRLGQVLAALILIRALTRILSAILRSQSQFTSSQAVELFLIPTLTIVLLVAWGGKHASLTDILTATLIAGCLAVMIGLALVYRRSSSNPDAIAVRLGALLVGSWPMWGMAISLNVADWYGLVSINQWGGAAEAGIYRVSAQISSVFGIVSLSLLSTFTAQIAAAMHRGDQPQMAQLSRNATRLAAAIFVLPGLIIFALAEHVVGLFGAEFISGANTLRALLAGQLVVAVFGVSGQVLVMTGHARYNLIPNLTATAIILIAAPIAAMSAGGLGVALLFLTLNIAKTTFYAAAVRRLEGFSTITGRVMAPPDRP